MAREPKRRKPSDGRTPSSRIGEACVAEVGNPETPPIGGPDGSLTDRQSSKIEGPESVSPLDVKNLRAVMLEIAGGRLIYRICACAKISRQRRSCVLRRHP